jgi:hypothetical protein
VAQPPKALPGEGAEPSPIGAPRCRVVGVVRARVTGVEVAAGGFKELVWQEVKRSRNIMRSELAAAGCVKAWLAQNGYAVREDYASVPRPFDMVVAKGGSDLRG